MVEPYKPVVEHSLVVVHTFAAQRLGTVEVADVVEDVETVEMNAVVQLVGGLEIVGSCLIG